MRISVMNGGLNKFDQIKVEDINDTILSQNYSCGIFKGGHRTNDNFIGAELIALDFDGGLRLDDAVEKFKDYWHVIGTTENHQKNKNGVTCDRFRVVLKLDDWVDNKGDFTATAMALHDKYPQADPQCKDAARYYKPCTVIVSDNKTGAVVPIHKYEAPEKKEKVEINSYMKGDLSKRTLDFIAFGAPGGSWNYRLNLATIDLKEQKYSKDEAIQLLTVATRDHDGELDAGDLKVINHVYDNKEVRHDPRGLELMFNFKKPSDMAKDVEKVDWLVQDILGVASLSIIVGAPKCGKSTITRQLALAAAEGGDWFGRQVKKTNVLYLALEEQEAMFNAQMRHIGMDDKHTNLHIHCGTPLPGDVKANLTEAIETFGAGLVIVDTMLLLADFNDINNYKDAYAALNPFRDIARQTGAHITMVHHANKMGEGMNKIMGSQGILGAVDCAIVMDSYRGDTKKRRLFSQGRGGKQFSGITLEYRKDADRYFKIEKGKRPEGL